MPEILILVSLLYVALPLFVPWKFHQVLSKINDNVAGVRDAIARAAGNQPPAIKS